MRIIKIESNKYAKETTSKQNPMHEVGKVNHVTI